MLLKMVRNYDVDRHGMVSTQNLQKVFKLMGHEITPEQFKKYQEVSGVRYEPFIENYCN